MLNVTKVQVNRGKDVVLSTMVGWHEPILSFGGFNALPLCSTRALRPIGCS